MSQENKMSIEQFLQMKRQNIILSYEAAKEQALRAFDDVVQLLAQSQKTLNEKENKDKPKDDKKK